MALKKTRLEINSHIEYIGTDEECDDIKSLSEAFCRTNGNEMRITYDNIFEGKKIGTVSIIFDKTDKDCVTIVKHGECECIYVYGKDMRHTASFSAGGISFEIVIVTNKIENTLSEDGGKLIIESTIENGGCEIEHADIEINMYV